MYLKFGICLASLFFTFVLELFAFRIGTAYLSKHGIAFENTHDMGLGQGTEVASGPAGDAEAGRLEPTKNASPGAMASNETLPDEKWQDASEANPAAAQILGVVILEFGVLFHSVSPLCGFHSGKTGLKLIGDLPSSSLD